MYCTLYCITVPIPLNIPTYMTLYLFLYYVQYFNVPMCDVNVHLGVSFVLWRSWILARKWPAIPVLECHWCTDLRGREHGDVPPVSQVGCRV